MIRTANIKQETVHILENISDLSYAWETLGAPIYPILPPLSPLPASYCVTPCGHVICAPCAALVATQVRFMCDLLCVDPWIAHIYNSQFAPSTRHRCGPI